MDDEDEVFAEMLNEFNPLENSDASISLKQPVVKQKSSDTMHQIDSNSGPRLRDVGIELLFPNELGERKRGKGKGKQECSLVHTGETDSSDDEQNKYFEEQKYNSFGAEIKKMLRTLSEDVETSATTQSWSKPTASKGQLCLPALPSATPDSKNDVYMDPVFGIKIVNPLVCSQTLQLRMEGRMPVPISKMKAHCEHGDLKKDWVVGAVIVHKSPPRVSQKGSNFMIWTVSDLKLGLKKIQVFLFGRAYQQLWKTPVGTVFGLLNPNVLHNKDDNKVEASLSIYNPDLVLVLGKAKDLGWCKSKKKNGDVCGNFVNVSQCEFCVFHVQSEYRRFTGRSELQSPTCSNMNSVNLRNKVLGKNEVFYGGQCFTSVPVKKASIRDNKRLSSLGANSSPSVKTPCNSGTPIGLRTMNLMDMLNNKRQSNDRNRLAALGKREPSCKNTGEDPKPQLTDPSKDVVLDIVATSITPPSRKSTSQNRFNQISAMPVANNTLSNLSLKHSSSIKTSTDTMRKVCKENSEPLTEPMMKSTSDSIDQGENVTVLRIGELKSPSTNTSKPVSESKKPLSRAKLNALAYAKKVGGIKKIDPDNKGRGVKRFLEHEQDAEDNVEHSVFSKEFLELMKVESANKDLVEIEKLKRQQQYFQKMEQKEKMEEKMVNTHSVECKLVRCLKCKYTWFSASDSCKADHHPLKVFTGIKRFFKCHCCSNRTAAPTFLPLVPCAKCGQTKWERTTMMKDKIVKNPCELSIRGGEEKFINSVSTNANINLLVPD